MLSLFKDNRTGLREYVTSHCEVAEMLARRLGFPEDVQRTLRQMLERWDGRGMAYGLKGNAIDVPAQILHLSQVIEVAHSLGGVSAAEAVARKRRGTDFNPQLVGIFLKLSRRPDFWNVLEQESVQAPVLAMKPSSDFDRVSESEVETVCATLADFTDIRFRRTWNHSPITAEVAVGIGRHLGLGQGDVKRLRRAALVHDLGEVAIPGSIAEKVEHFTESEWERYRLHPYYTERILVRVEALKDLAPEAAAHHEWVNGQGYFRQLSSQQIPLGARVLAVADTYALLSHEQGDQTDAGVVLQQMRPLVGTQLDPSCFEALAASLSGAALPRSLRPRGLRPGNLSEREIELLSHLARGLSNRQIAKALVISEKTVEHHLDHIYNKLGVSSRTAAVVFAVQNGIVA